jgi:adenylate kinase
MNAIISIVTGAPGSGKTTALEALLRRASPYLAFDIDWLTIPASQLARSDIIFDRSTWPVYNALWFEFLHALHKNGKIAIFFAPIDTHDVARYGQPAWCERIDGSCLTVTMERGKRGLVVARDGQPQ